MMLPDLELKANRLLMFLTGQYPIFIWVFHTISFSSFIFSMGGMFGIFDRPISQSIYGSFFRKIKF